MDEDDLQLFRSLKDEIEAHVESKYEQVQNFNEGNEECVGHEPEEQEASLNDVLDWLKNNSYEHRINTRKRRTRCLLMVSESMKVNYNNNHDLLSFDILHNIISPLGSPQLCVLGLFTVANHNSKPLLAGVALLADEEPSTIYTMIG